MSRNAYFVATAILAAIAGIAASPLASAFSIYTVGGDAACNFAFIQDAIDAAAANPGEDYVWIASNRTYEDQHLVVTDQDVDIEGGFTDCSDFDPEADQTTIGGISGHSVFEIEGASHVYIANMTITGGDLDGDHSGGGIYFGGSGSLELRTTTVTGNNAGYGGGIDMDGGSGPATLTLDQNSLIVNNTASVSGGGVRLEGQARLIAVLPLTLIGFNQAPNGYGGGVEVIGPAQADIGSPGYGGIGVIDGNSAEYGGGISINDSENSDPAVARIFTTDPQNPVTISDNGASATGGGVYLKSHSNFGFSPNNRAVLCAYDFVVDGNVAQEGAAMYADEDTYGSTIALNTAPLIYGDDDFCNTPEPPSALGGVACAAGVDCNRVDNNIAQLSDGTPTDGSAILIQSDGAMFADRFQMRGNQGAHAIRFVDDGGAEPTSNEGVVAIHDCVLAGNTSTQELIYASPDTSTDGTQMIVDRCTIADNQIGAANVMHVAANFAELTDSIVDQPGVQTLDFAGPLGDLTAAFVLTNNASTLTGGTEVVDGEPSFVDPTNGDYHLQRTSLGVDFAPAVDGSDLGGQPRTVDLIDIPNGPGPMDLGAYEIQTQILSCATADTIFCDGFDGG